MLTRDGVAGLVCLAVSIWLLLLTRGLPPAIMVPIGPAFYPRVVLLILAALSLVLIGLDVATAAQRRAAIATAPEAVEPPPNYRLVLATFLEFGLYIVLLPELGFRLATFVFVLALQITLDLPRSWKRWSLAVIVALATSFVCYLVFEDYLSVILPRGSWSGL
ncbi:putative tricarboxylic transport membrane protein [Nitrobacteraceae bacterium AZCC 1564]